MTAVLSDCTVASGVVSVPSNIADAARSSTGELGHFLGIALGSAAELETKLESIRQTSEHDC